MSKQTIAKDIHTRGKTLSAQRPLIMDEPEYDAPTTIRMARIGLICLFLAALTVAVLNSQSLLKLSRDLPAGDMRTVGELWASEWHSLMRAAGPAHVTASVRKGVQWLRQRSWSGENKDETEEDAAGQTRRAATIHLAKCLTDPAVQRDFARQQDVKAHLNGKPLVILSITQLKDDPALMDRAARLCGFIDGPGLAKLLQSN